MKNSASENFHSETGTWFTDRSLWRTLFPSGALRGKIFCEFSCHRADVEFFNKIGSFETFAALWTSGSFRSGGAQTVDFACDRNG
ncbi:hypothetical protein [Roseovarius sp. MMSF_3281]|uniref:hypothetical protein n=1 Tax=Roseovarius sp. MMSF_3281 TaxID=3046694 RepID=UPI00273E735C|nr:hypothetical protein [Roseovarius sp. MMSF_3281]